MEIFSIMLLVLANFSAALMVTLSLNLEVGLLGIPQFGRLLAVVTGAIIAAAVPGRVIACSLDLPCGLDFARHLYNYSIMKQVNDWLAQNPLLSVATLLFTVTLAAAVGALIGLACAYPAIRLKEAYLGITLLAFGDLMVNIAKNVDVLAGGTMGVMVVDVFRFVGAGPARAILAAVVLLLAAILSYVYCELLVRSPMGRTLKAARDAEVAASVLGKDIVKLRKRALMTGGAIAGAAGALWALFTGGFMADTYTRLTWTFWPWAFMMLGGVGNNLGVLLGVVLYTCYRTVIILYKGHIAQLLGIAPEWLEYILVGLILVVVVLFRPQGLLPEKPTLALPKGRIRKIAEESS